MPRPEKYTPERFGRLTGLLPENAAGRVKGTAEELPKELKISGLPQGGWVSRGVYRMERSVPFGRKYGNRELENPNRNFDVLRPWGASSPCVYLDLETTGLSRGTGTYAFLAGLGFCEEDTFRVVQLFLAGPGFERNWLAALEDELPNGCGLVTYNGQTFDLPLLRTRYTLAKARPSWHDAPHMDLLKLARHFYKGRVPSCSLSAIEPRILGVRRGGEDIPGSEIPAIYTEFLQTEDAAPLRGIFYHNTLDIVSLASLQSHIADLANMKGLCGEDMLRCGDLWSASGDTAKAEDAWRRALDFKTHTSAANARLAECARRGGKFETAKDLFEKAACGDRYPVKNLENLAKIEEHKLKNYTSALEHTEQALKWLEAHRAMQDFEWGLTRQNLLHRIRRLKHKIEKEEKN